MWKCVSRLSPRKTRMVPVHCSVVMELPKRRTEPRMVKNFLVVVTMEQVRGPKLTTVRKMKVWWRHVKQGQLEVQDVGKVAGPAAHLSQSAGHSKEQDVVDDARVTFGEAQEFPDFTRPQDGWREKRWKREGIQRKKNITSFQSSPVECAESAP